MKLIIFRHLWGTTGEWEDLFPRFRRAGYRGIESALPSPENRERFRSLLRKHSLEFIPQIFSQGKSVADHLESLREQIAAVRTFAPRLVNAHSGQDAFSEDESIRFFEGALRLEAESGVVIAHETHRGRILFNPWSTARLLTRFPPLKLCCDFSHWVCVCERLIGDQIGIIRQCAKHCLHVHARVGYEQGPQVPDPRAPIVPDEDDGGEPEGLDDLADVGGHAALVVAPGRAVGVAVAAQVGSDDGEALGQRGHDLAPHVTGLGVPVEQEERGAAPHPAVVDAHAFPHGHEACWARMLEPRSAFAARRRGASGPSVIRA